MFSAKLQASDILKMFPVVCYALMVLKGLSKAGFLLLINLMNMM